MEEKQLLDYFKSIADRQGKYHDHKEVSAWAGLVLHLIFCGALLRVEAPTKYPQLAFVLVFVAVVVAAALAYLYIRKQLELKDLAGAEAGAATYFMSSMATSSDGKLHESLTPIKQSADTNFQRTHVMPASFVEKTDWLNTQGRGAQDATRRYVYSLLITASVFVVGFNALRFLG